MATELTFDAIRLPPECEALRKDVRAFIAKEIDAGSFDPHSGGIDGAYSADFSRKVGAKGWIGMTWPKKYGGHERSFLERYVVTEEFRVANAPVRLHFVADRQSGPVILKYASERIKADVLPRCDKGKSAMGACWEMVDDDTCAASHYRLEIKRDHAKVAVGWIGEKLGRLKPNGRLEYSQNAMATWVVTPQAWIG